MYIYVYVYMIGSDGPPYSSTTFSINDFCSNQNEAIISSIRESSNIFTNEFTKEN